MTALDDQLLRAALAPAREIEPTDAEVARALAASPRGFRLRDRGLALAMSVLVVVAAGAYAVPVTRAGIEDVLGAFTGWIGGDNDDAPGTAVDPGGAPPWLRHVQGTPRLIAQSEGVELYAVRTDEGRLAFELNGSVAIDDTIAGWRETFAEQAVVVLGTSGFNDEPFDSRGRRPLYGATARRVKRIELTYAEGRSLTARDLDGGFVLLADAARPLQELIAYDANGHVVQRLDVSDLELRVCRRPSGCSSPDQLEP